MLPAVHFNLTYVIILLYVIKCTDMQMFQEWCERSEFMPDEDTDDAKIDKAPNAVSWIKLPYPLSKALQNRVAEHEEGQWTFPLHLIPPFKPGKINCLYSNKIISSHSSSKALNCLLF